MDTILFDEIIPGANARMCVIKRVQYLSCRDIIMHLGDKKASTANKTWERLLESKKEELSTECQTWRFPGSGQVDLPVITFKGALKLVQWVGGENAEKYRSAMAKILQKHYTGAGSLLDEADASAKQSSSDIPSSGMVSEASEELYLPYKRKLAELEVAKRETEVQATKIANRAAELANLGIEREHLMACTCGYRELCEDTVMDERARLILKDNFLNMAMLQAPARGSGQGLLEGHGALNPSKPISLSLVVGELGLKIPSNELISIGAELKKRYVEKHGKEPGKHEQLCGGRMTRVNSYMESDRPLLEEVLLWHVAKSR